MLQYKQILIILLLGFVFASCANVFAATQKTSVLINKKDLAVLKESAHQLSEAKPQLDRLLKLESELKHVVDKLKQQDAQPIVSKNAQISHLAKVDSHALFSVQVGAYKNKAVLEAAIKHLQFEQQQSPNKHVVNTEQVLVNNHIFYRLKLGAFKTKEAAKKACKSLKINNNCFVTYYVKTPQS